MACYKNMASVYEQIFPLIPDTLRFIQRCLAQSPSRILDVGCATGQLALELATQNHMVTGIDSNSDMIKRARSDAAVLQNNARFFVMNMNRISHHFPEATFDLVLCLGNTLVHLHNMQEIDAFLSSIFQVLPPDGSFVIQILNYSKILEKRPEFLQTIHNERIVFKRTYSYKNLPEFVLFSSELTDRSTGEMYTNTIELFPLGYEALINSLTRIGFQSVRLFSSYTMAHFTPTSDVCLVIARKTFIQ